MDGCVGHIVATYSFLKDKRVFIYGAKKYGRFLAKAFVEYGCTAQTNIKAFIDDFDNGFEVDGIPVKSLDSCDLRGNDYCVILAMRETAKLKKRLKNRGIAFFADSEAKLDSVMIFLMNRPLFQTGEKSNVGNILMRISRFHELKFPEKEVERFFEDELSLQVLRNRIEFYKTGQVELLETICPVATEEYFGPGLLQIGDSENYIDCGAYDGDSVRAFVAHTKGRYKRIIAFEPHPESFKALKKNTAGLPNLDLVAAATGNQNGEVRFITAMGTGAACSDMAQGTMPVRMVRLDDFILGPVTLVKMDIEGAELDALHGMERILKEQRPKLAICAYHKVEDLFTLPQYIKSVVPEYRLKLRQHQANIYETVLYAEI